MADTAIEWADRVWNPTVGCSVISPGCANCYAMRMAARLERMGSKVGAKYAGLTFGSKAGAVWTGIIRADPDSLALPLRWRKPRRIFVNSMSDLFHEALPDASIDRIFAVMALCPQHTFLVLTKRAARMRRYLADPSLPIRIGGELMKAARGTATSEATVIDLVHRMLTTPLPNVWPGVSVEDQTRADERLPHLRATPAAVRWVSAEPLMGPIDIGQGLDWVVAGGESSPGARPAHPDWFRSLRDQCDAAGVPFFFKQWGEWASVSEVAGTGVHHRFVDGATVRRTGKKAGGHMLDGREHREFPR